MIKLFDNAQAKRISDLSETVKRQQCQIDYLELQLARVEKSGKFYLEMQAAILNNEILMDKWQEFCMLLKFTVTEIGSDPKFGSEVCNSCNCTIIKQKE